MPYIGRTLGQGTRSRFLYTATAGQTTFSGSDSQSNTLAYSDNNGVDCFQNGVLLKGGGADYTATSGTSVVLTTGASVNDVIEILVYDVFAIADHIKKSGDAMTGALTNIDVNGTELILDADGDTSITSDTDDQIDFKIGGNDRVTIDSSGNVGIVSSTTQTNDSTPALTVETQGHSQIRLNGDGNEFAIMALDSSVAGDHFIIYDKNNSAERMRVSSSGTAMVGKTASNIGTAGFEARSSGETLVTRNSDTPFGVNRLGNDGPLVGFYQATSVEGTISVSGSTVSYNGFSGQHESSGIATNTPIGTVVSTIDELDTYPTGTPKEGQTRTDHAKVEVSDTVGDSAVYGVVTRFDDNDKVFVASVGIGSVRVTGKCAKGDLLESNGDGTAKVQSDDIVRSKTIGKVTIGNSSTDEKLVSCVLYCG